MGVGGGGGGGGGGVGGGSVLWIYLPFSNVCIRETDRILLPRPPSKDCFISACNVFFGYISTTLILVPRDLCIVHQSYSLLSKGGKRYRVQTPGIILVGSLECEGGGRGWHGKFLVLLGLRSLAFYSAYIRLATYPHPHPVSHTPFCLSVCLSVCLSLSACLSLIVSSILHQFSPLFLFLAKKTNARGVNLICQRFNRSTERVQNYPLPFASAYQPQRLWVICVPLSVCSFN